MKRFIAAILGVAVILAAQFAWADSTIETPYGVATSNGRTERVDTTGLGVTGGISAPRGVADPATTTNFGGYTAHEAI